MRFTSYSHGDLMLLVGNHSTPAWAGAGGEPGSSDQLPAFYLILALYASSTCWSGVQLRRSRMGPIINPYFIYFYMEPFSLITMAR